MDNTVLLCLGLLILAFGVVVLAVSGGRNDDRISKLEGIHTWGKWHDD